jgi:thiopurine S-methyltransferase
MTDLNAKFWEHRYREGSTGWDLKKASRPITSYIDDLEDRNIEILIPGAGNAYEAEYLWNKGFKNLYVLDIARQPLNNLKQRLPDLPEHHLILGDFFKNTGQYDLIIEQTFFCALSPTLRKKYRDHMLGLLKPAARVAGLLFNFPLTDQGPPFGGDFNEYQTLFKDKFHVKTMEPCYNSEPSRIGKALFFIFEKKHSELE